MYRFGAILCFLCLTSFCFSQAKVEPSKEYLLHLDAAKSHGVTLIKDQKQLNRLISKGSLVKVKQRGYGYRVTDLTHSHPYLVPQANKIVADIAREFVRITGQNFFVVTSLTRTLEDQKRLRKVNSNASVNDSSHNFGAAFDISYVRFNHQLQHNKKLEKHLEDVLQSFVRAGKIFYVKENKIKCFHVIVRQ
ncbi:DUF5715 family protein [Weeksella sp. HMSC059D05]|uniref:DUF5715 family protein n=1 Tax=Weeksella sp. HMSC059D05 TaxID=1715139 RepID=UPI0008A46E14|nr:DUF5715 family protein [Weeksella sp. HMSC059D05]OFM84523.1 hypothetical protein HMPREF2660_08410 [Weeksella sp. HMSC059D05]